MEVLLQILLIVFFSVVGVQLLYYIFFLVAFSKKRRVQESTPLPVSVIICAHDEEANLKELIPLLLSQDHPEFEVIVIDDRSNDNTFDWLLAETQKDHRLRMVHVNRTPPHVNGKKYGLTLGIKAARFEWLLFSDADCRPVGNGWISSMASHFTTETNFVLGFSPYLKVGGLLNLFIRFESLVTGIQYLSYALGGNPYMGVGRNLAYRRSLFLGTKGFNNHLKITGGDDDLFVNEHANGSNTAVCVDAPSIMPSLPLLSWRAFFRQKVRHLSVGKYYKAGNKFLLGVFKLTWLASWFLGLTLLILPHNQYDLYWITGALLVRTLMFSLVIGVAAKKLHQRFGTLAVPLLDFIYAFYYLVIGLTTLVSKKVRWKN